MVAGEPVNRTRRGVLQTRKLLGLNGPLVSMLSTLNLCQKLEDHEDPQVQREELHDDEEELLMINNRRNARA
jgi:hypothetical protein